MFKTALVLLYLTLLGYMQYAYSEITLEDKNHNINYGVSLLPRNGPRFFHGRNIVSNERSREPLIFFMPGKTESEERDMEIHELSSISQQENLRNKVKTSALIQGEDSLNKNNHRRRILVPRDIMLPKDDDYNNSAEQPNPYIQLYKLRNGKLPLRNSLTRKIEKKGDNSNEDESTLLEALREKIRRNYENGFAERQMNERPNGCDKKNYVCYCQEDLCRGKSSKKGSVDDDQNSYGKRPWLPRRDRMDKKKLKMEPNDDENRLKTLYDYLSGPENNLPPPSLPVNPQYAHQNEQSQPNLYGTVGASHIDKLKNYHILPVYGPISVNNPASNIGSVPNILQDGLAFRSSKNSQTLEEQPDLQKVFQVLNAQQLPDDRQSFQTWNEKDGFEDNFNTDTPQNQLIGNTLRAGITTTPDYEQSTTGGIKSTESLNYNVEECMDVCGKKVCIISGSSTPSQYDLTNVGDTFKGIEMTTEYDDYSGRDKIRPTIVNPTTFDSNLNFEMTENLQGLQTPNYDFNDDLPKPITTSNIKSDMAEFENIPDGSWPRFTGRNSHPANALHELNRGNYVGQEQFITDNPFTYSDMHSTDSIAPSGILQVTNSIKNSDTINSEENIMTEEAVSSTYDANDFAKFIAERTHQLKSLPSSTENITPKYPNVDETVTKSLSNEEEYNQEDELTNTYTSSDNPDYANIYLDENEDRASESTAQSQSDTETIAPYLGLTQLSTERSENEETKPYEIITEAPVIAITPRPVFGKSKTYSAKRVELKSRPLEETSKEGASNSLDNQNGEMDIQSMVTTKSYFGNNNKLSRTKISPKFEKMKINSVSNINTESNTHITEMKPTSPGYWDVYAHYTTTPNTDYSSPVNLRDDNVEYSSSMIPIDMSTKTYSRKLMKNTSPFRTTETTETHKFYTSINKPTSAETRDLDSPTDTVFASTLKTLMNSTPQKNAAEADYVMGAPDLPDDERDLKKEDNLEYDISETENTTPSTEYLTTLTRGKLSIYDYPVLENVIKRVLNEFASDGTAEEDSSKIPSVESLKNRQEHLSPDVLNAPNPKALLEPDIERVIIGKIQNELSKITGLPKENFMTDRTYKTVTDTYRNIVHTIPNLHISSTIPPINVQEHEFENYPTMRAAASIPPNSNSPRPNMSTKTYSGQIMENTSPIRITERTESHNFYASTNKPTSAEIRDSDSPTDTIFASTLKTLMNSSPKKYSGETDYVIGAPNLPDDEKDLKIEDNLAHGISKTENTTPSTEYLTTLTRGKLSIYDYPVLMNVIKRVLNEFVSDETAEEDPSKTPSLKSLIKTDVNLSPDVLNAANPKALLEPDIEHVVLGKIQNELSKITGLPKENFMRDWTYETITDTYRNIVRTIPSLRISSTIPPINVQEHEFKNYPTMRAAASIPPNSNSPRPNMSTKTYSGQIMENTSPIRITERTESHNFYASTNKPTSAEIRDSDSPTDTIFASTLKTLMNSAPKKYSGETDYVIGALNLPYDEKDLKIEDNLAHGISKTENTTPSPEYLTTLPRQKLSFYDYRVLENVIKRVLNEFASDGTAEKDSSKIPSVESLKNREENLSSDVLNAPNPKALLEPDIERVIIGEIQKELSKITGLPMENFMADWTYKTITDTYRNIVHTIPSLHISSTIPPINVQEHEFKNYPTMRAAATIAPNLIHKNVVSQPGNLQAHMTETIHSPAFLKQDHTKSPAKNFIVGNVKSALEKEHAKMVSDVDNSMNENVLKSGHFQEGRTETLDESISTTDDVDTITNLSSITVDNLMTTESTNIIKPTISNAELIAEYSPFGEEQANIYTDDTLTINQMFSSTPQTLLDEEYDTSPIKYYSPKDRILNYIRNHLPSDNSTSSDLLPKIVGATQKTNVLLKSTTETTKNEDEYDSTEQQNEEFETNFYSKANNAKIFQKNGENHNESSNLKKNGGPPDRRNLFFERSTTRKLPSAIKSVTSQYDLDRSGEDYKFKLTTPNIYEFVGNIRNQEDHKLNKYLPAENMQEELVKEQKVWSPTYKSTIKCREVTTEKQRTIKRTKKQYGPNRSTGDQEDSLLKEHESEENIYEKSMATEREETMTSPYSNLQNDMTYFGKLLPERNVNSGNDISDLLNSNLFYVGDGVKLPLEIKALSDGSYALSISQKICENIMKRKCPCCVPINGNVVRTLQGNSEADSTISTGANDAKLLEKSSKSISQGKERSYRRMKRSARTDSIKGEIISMPVIEFVKKYNLLLSLEPNDTNQEVQSNTDTLTNSVRREEINSYLDDFENDNNINLKKHQSNSIKREILNLPNIDNIDIDNESNAKVIIKDEKASNFDYEKNTSIQDNQGLPKKTKKKPPPYRYQRNANDTSMRRMIALRSLIYFLKNLFVDEDKAAGH